MKVNHRAHALLCDGKAEERRMCGWRAISGRRGPYQTLLLTGMRAGAMVTVVTAVCGLGYPQTGPLAQEFRSGVSAPPQLFMCPRDYQHGALQTIILV